MRIRSIGFRGGRFDSTASNVKMRRGTKIQEIEREEFVEIENTADLTDVEYDEPENKKFETKLKENELELIGKDFNDGIGFFVNKDDIDVIYEGTPHYGIKSQGGLQNNSSFTTNATSNLGASYNYRALLNA